MSIAAEKFACNELEVDEFAPWMFTVSSTGLFVQELRIVEIQKSRR
jgi:hypothetical protein